MGLVQSVESPSNYLIEASAGVMVPASFVENNSNWFEEVLNPPASTTPPESKGWEIVEYWNAGGHHSPLPTCKAHGCLISSVKRTSDNLVFSVQEDTPKGKISKFELPHPDGNMYVHYDLGGWDYLYQCKKLPPKPLPVKLFTTSDMVDIFPGTPYWHIVSDWTPQMEIAVETGREEYGTRKMQTFSTEEAAKNWVAWNKSQFSLTEIMAQSVHLLQQYWRFDRDKLTELAQSKQSKDK
jgi:hypothetical protein